jgi:CheY-like chemotaxis protein
MKVKDVNYLKSNGVNVEKSLELFGDMEMYDSTLNDFLKDVENRLASLKKYREIGDMKNYAIEVHALKSDARYLGFVTLADLAYEFELKSKANDIMFVYENYTKLLDEANRCIKIACEYLGKEVKSDLINDMVNPIPNEAILVVDDSNLVANFIKKIFDDKYEVWIASDGARAIELVSGPNASKIKGMLLDLNMPNVNGFAVLEYFKKNNLFIKIPVSIITGNDTKDQVEQAFNYPIVDLLSKPFNERDIRRIIEKTIQKY